VVERLGLKAMLPVEVVRFAHAAQVPYLRELGAAPALRPGRTGSRSSPTTGTTSTTAGSPAGSPTRPSWSGP
jgi:ribose 5-phosphate isomerase